MQGEAVSQVTYEGSRVYGPNGVELGHIDAQGLVRLGGAVTFKIVRNAIYSMHGQHLGTLSGGIGLTSRGQFILAVEGLRPWD